MWSGVRSPPRPPALASESADVPGFVPGAVGLDQPHRGDAYAVAHPDRSFEVGVHANGQTAAALVLAADPFVDADRVVAHGGDGGRELVLDLHALRLDGAADPPGEGDRDGGEHGENRDDHQTP